MKGQSDAVSFLTVKIKSSGQFWRRICSQAAGTILADHLKALKNLKGNTPRVTYESGKSCEIDHARTMLRAYLFINKESQHVSKATLKELDAKDVLLVFPEKSKKNKTVRVLKTPKTDSSVT